MTWFALCFLSASALAQDGFDAHGFDYAPSDGDTLDPLSTWRPEAQVPGSVGFTALFEYANEPLVLYQQEGDEFVEYRLLDDLFAANLGVHGAVHERIAIAASWPVYLTSQGLDGSNGFGVGDLRVFVPVGLVMPGGGSTGDGEGFGLSVMPFANVPIGDDQELLGSAGFGGGAFFMAGVQFGGVQAAFDLGYEQTPTLDYENVQGGGQLLTRLSLGYAPTETIGITAEAVWDRSLKGNDVPNTESPGEFLGSFRYRAPSGPAVTLGGAGAFTPGVGAASYRLFLGLGWTIGKPITDDRDGDGIVDELDDCPTEPEVFNDILDEDGCPDAAGVVRVVVTNDLGEPVPDAEVYVNGFIAGTTDSAGVYLLADADPGEQVTVEVSGGPGTGLASYDLGSLTIEEGATDHEVMLGWLPGSVMVVTKSADGPVGGAYVTFLGGEFDRDTTRMDDDGRRIFVLDPGDWEVLVEAEEFGIVRRGFHIEPDRTSLLIVEVTLAPAEVAITKEEVVLLEQVHFDFDSAEIADDSMGLLIEVANNLVAHLDIRTVEIQGHTDSEGSSGYNLDLSQRRMDAVVAHLVEHGVARDRLVPVGFGEACPLADNDSDAGRAANRRVQFIITDPAPKRGIPCRDGNPARMAEPREVK